MRPGPGPIRTRLSWFARRWLLVPDKEVLWYPQAVRSGRAEIAMERPDVIVASIGPRTNALVGARLARESGCPLLLEYRDLWTGNPYHHLGVPTAWHGRLHRRLESHALAAATSVTCLSEGIRDHLRMAFAMPANVHVHRNFFDPAEIPVRRPGANEARFTMGYFGAFYGERHPGVFMEALDRLVASGRVSPSTFRLRWAGPMAGVPAACTAPSAQAARACVEYLGVLDHARAMEELVACDAALVMAAPADAIHIPGKIFEAMGARVPVLLVAGDGEAGRIIETAGAGLVVRHDPVAIADGLGRLISQRGRAWPYCEDERLRFDAAAAVPDYERILDAAISSGRTGTGA